MPRFRDTHELNGHLAHHFECHIKLFSLLDRTAQIVLRMQKHGRRGDAMRRHQWRALTVVLGPLRVPRIAFGVDRHPVADVRSTDKAGQIGDTSHRNSRFETIGMPDGEHRHIATIAVARHYQSLRISHTTCDTFISCSFSLESVTGSDSISKTRQGREGLILHFTTFSTLNY